MFMLDKLIRFSWVPCALILGSWNGFTQNSETLIWDWNVSETNGVPDGFRNSRTGYEGKKGVWEIIETDTPAPVFYQEITSELPLQKGRAIQQTSFSSQPNRFPILLFEDKTFGDFKFVTRFQLNGGGFEQMAGVIFRVQDDQNYYIVRASGPGSNLAFYRFIDGLPTEPVLTAEAEFEKNQWYTLSIETLGPQITVRLDGKKILPLITDTTFAQGKIGLWTKADSISSFAETRIDFEPEVNRFEGALQWAMDQNRKIKDARIVALPNTRSRYQVEQKQEDTDGESSVSSLLKVMASTREEEIGQPATEFEKRCLDENTSFTAKKQKPRRWVFLAPLHDNNGEAFAVLRVEMKRGFGLSKSVSLAQALGLAKEIEAKAGLW